MECITLFIKDSAGTLAFILAVGICACFEVSPIKFNPISWIVNLFTRQTREQLAEISEKLETVSDRIDKIEINDMRSTILDFANSCMNERKHTKEEFDHIIDIHTAYEEIIAEKGMKNGRVDLAFKYISELYTKCLKENSFLDS